MKEQFLAAALIASTLLGSETRALSADYQFTGTGNVFWPAGSYSVNDWNQNSPWSGRPPNNQGPGAGDTLNLAATGAGAIYLTNGGAAVFRDYSVGNIAVTADAGAVIQQIRGSSDTRANLNAGSIEVSGSASLQLFRGHANGRILVSASNTTVAVGSTLYIGGTDVTTNASQVLDGFQISGTTSVSGTLSFHYQNRNATGQFHLGDLAVASTGSVILANFISSIASDSAILNYEVRSISGSGKVYGLGQNATNASSLISTLTINTGASSDAVFSGTISNIAAGGTYTNRVVALAVSGSGRQTLTGHNGYTGATTLSGGGLVLSENGSINSTSGITINGGALIQNSTAALTAPVSWQAGKVGGLGTITGNLTASGAGAKLLTPGDGELGTLTVTGGLTLDANTTVQFTLNGLTAGVDYNVLSIGDAFGLNNAVLDLNLGFAAALNDEFTIARFGSRIGTFAGLVDESLFDMGNYTFQIHYNTGDVTLQVVAVPEPGTAALLSLSGLAAGVGLSQRRRQGAVKTS